MSQMEFWGAEVQSGESLEVDPGQDVVLHLSQASIGEVKKDKSNERIRLFVKVDDQKLTLGTMSSEKLPQISFDLVFEKKFQLSHNWKKGSVYFTGYRAHAPKDNESSESDAYFDMEPNSEAFRVDHHHIGKSELEAKQAAKLNASTAKQVRIVEPNKVKVTDEEVGEDTSSDEESSDESDDDEAKVSSEEESSDDGSDDDSGEDEDEETPKELKSKENKKRTMEPAKKNPADDKKAKFISPEKTVAGIKKFGGHVATPHPSKQPVTKQQTPKSGGAYPCKSCNRSFSSETGLQSHTKAKHSAVQ